MIILRSLDDDFIRILKHRISPTKLSRLPVPMENIRPQSPNRVPAWT